MDFTSLTFLFIFFPLFLLLLLFAKPSAKLLLISIANIIFICTGQYQALLPLVGLSLTGYIIGRLIEDNKSRKEKVFVWVWLGVGINVGILIIFKLLQVNETASLSIGSVQFNSMVPLLGLSYITFQLISYIVDVSRNEIPAESNIAKFMAYILFFPKLVSGPITRYKLFSDQISSVSPDINDIAAGLRRILIGVLKRMLIANQLAMVTDSVFNRSTPNVEPLFAWLGLIAYTLQIYYDFSGYSDIAVGLGKIIGINLPENFNYPYTAQSISDFWRRWHMTLSSWFRDYVFYPLERRRLKFAGQQINLVIVFILTGLWHGPTLTYLCWGLLYGLAIAFESTGGGRWLKTVWQPIRHLYVLLIVGLGWVFFRSPNMDFALGYIARLLGDTRGLQPLPFSLTSPFPFIEPSFIIVMLAGVLFSLPLASIWKDIKSRLQTENEIRFFLLQTAEDFTILLFFVLAIASQMSAASQSNIYANF